MNAAVSVFFNHLEQAAPCGGTGAKAVPAHRIVGAAKSLVGLALDLDPTTPNGGEATITVTGPAEVWFGVAFGATEMSQEPGAIIVDGYGNVTEYQLQEHVGGTRLPTQVKTVSNTVRDGVRTVVLARKFAGATPAHYTFKPTGNSDVVEFMNAVGSSATYSFHKEMSSSSVLLAKVGVANCLFGEDIVFGQTKGAFIYTHDDNTTETIYSHSGGCTNSTPTDLIPMRNPRCDVSTYVGGLSCCHHKWLLTDRAQRTRISDEELKFRMKIRIWYQEYIPATDTAPASHQLLTRMYHSSVDDVQVDDEGFDQLQIDDDEQVTSFGVDVHQQVFPVGGTTQGVVVDDTPPSATTTATSAIFARIGRMRYLSEAFLRAGQEWQDTKDLGARARRNQLRAELNTLMSGPAPMSASAATTDSV